MYPFHTVTYHYSTYNNYLYLLARTEKLRLGRTTASPPVGCAKGNVRKRKARAYGSVGELQALLTLSTHYPKLSHAPLTLVHLFIVLYRSNSPYLTPSQLNNLNLPRITCLCAAQAHPARAAWERACESWSARAICKLLKASRACP